ncbi:nitrate ABC transporter substrate-binding protein [Nocardia miyunensis]|uniref:nitrate ABC transporter substrate-binding protein n=1 Tax=Nocardia miyunensis TaxID=282684 RepID=UPI00082A7966|nr:nitrate ABC transporter substrate-binding protein [Nocardia miyunensis]
MSLFHAHITRRAVALAAALTIGACTLAACGSSTTPAPSVSLAPAPAAQRLAGVCPDTLTVQLQWQPQADMGAMFQLLGPDYTVDTNTKSVTGTLVAQGKNTGIKLRLKSGGSAIGFQSVASQMYVDSSIDLGLVHGDQIVAASAGQRVVGVTPLLTHNPAILMWDSAAHPGLNLRGLAASHATVVVSKEQTFPTWLLAKGYVTKSQLDTSYDGSPARFVGDPSIVQQGYADAEPWEYEHDTPAWNKPVASGRLSELGFDPYASNVSVRADRLAQLTPCLKKLVPIVQQADADFVTAPTATDKLIADVVAKDPAYATYSLAEARYASGILKSENLIANENGSVGTYDPARAHAFVTDLAPLLAAQGAKVDPKVDPATLFDPEFGDRSIGIR